MSTYVLQVQRGHRSFGEPKTRVRSTGDRDHLRWQVDAECVDSK
ncbi:hypothetical protein ACFVRD_22920 [Streptomyces sp. NPDC057908]